MLKSGNLTPLCIRALYRKYINKTNGKPQSQAHLKKTSTWQIQTAFLVYRKTIILLHTFHFIFNVINQYIKALWFLQSISMVCPNTYTKRLSVVPTQTEYNTTKNILSQESGTAHQNAKLPMEKKLLYWSSK